MSETTSQSTDSGRAPTKRARVAIAIGDPAGIGCEITLKALADPLIRPWCDPVVVGDRWLIERCNQAFNLGWNVRPVHDPRQLVFDPQHLNVLDIAGRPEADFRFGETAAINGRALIAYVTAAVGLAQRGLVDCVIAAPQNETSVAQAGIPFDGYSSFVARLTDTAAEDAFLMLRSHRFRICHATLHISLREAIAQITQTRVFKAICATAAATQRMGVANPRIAVSGLNPHAGEHGLFGSEEIEHIAPAIAQARASGIDAHGPWGADVMFARETFDACVVMIHDQGHIPGKLEQGSAGFAIGTPIVFASVAHGSAHDIAGRGSADPGSLINAIQWACGS